MTRSGVVDERPVWPTLVMVSEVFAEHGLRVAGRMAAKAGRSPAVAMSTLLVQRGCSQGAPSPGSSVGPAPLSDLHGVDDHDPPAVRVGEEGGEGGDGGDAGGFVE
jgi:hypothetical protein